MACLCDFERYFDMIFEFFKERMENIEIGQKMICSIFMQAYWKITLS
jgi:hypothetical protein